MKYREIVDGIFLDRPNRFIAHVDVNGTVETVHVKNTGRCRELLLPGAAVPGSADRIARIIKEIFVLYVLSHWFDDRLPEKAQYIVLQYDEAMDLLKARLNRRVRPIERPVRFL